MKKWSMLAAVMLSWCGATIAGEISIPQFATPAANSSKTVFRSFGFGIVQNKVYWVWDIANLAQLQSRPHSSLSLYCDCDNKPSTGRFAAKKQGWDLQLNIRLKSGNITAINWQGDTARNLGLTRRDYQAGRNGNYFFIAIDQAKLGNLVPGTTFKCKTMLIDQRRTLGMQYLPQVNTKQSVGVFKLRP